MNNTAEQSTEEIIRFIDETNDFLWRQRGTSAGAEQIIELGKKAFEESIRLNYTFGLARAKLNGSMSAFIIENDVPKGIKILEEALALFTKLENKKWIANAHATQAIIKNTVGNKEGAVYHILKSLNYYENAPEEETDLVMIYYIAGTIYKDIKKFPEAEKHYLKGVEWEKKEKSNWSGRVFMGLANVYNETGDHDKALTWSFTALKVLQAEKNDIGESRALSDIGVIYKKKGDYVTALKYLNEGLAIRMQKKFKQFVITSYLEIAALHSETNNVKEAITNLEKGMGFAVEIKQTAKLARIYEDLAANYKLIGDFEKAVVYLEKLLSVTNELNKVQSETRIDSLHSAVVKEKEEEIERLRNVELKNAHKLITEKNKEITDSINYARIIQQGILPTEEEQKACLKEHFIYYKPKDIVSGDFYWCKKLSINHEEVEVTVFAAADCTGHGVPGAFMSMLGNTLLNQTVKSGEVTSPADALNHINQELPKNLKSQSKLNTIKDGMDISLCAIEWNSKKLLFAGANNPIWIVRDKQLMELKPDKQAITASDELEKKSFTNKSFTLLSNDMVYLFTDGFADQFGGPKGKKFKYSNLQNLLVENAHLSVNEQSKLLNNAFESWKGDLEQVDDVLIIGLKI